MVRKKLLLLLIPLFAVASVPHFEEAAHAAVHEKGIPHTHDRADAARTHAHFHLHHDHASEDSGDSPFDSHHHGCHYERGPIASGSASQARFGGSMQLSSPLQAVFDSSGPSADLSPPTTENDLAPPGGLSKAYFRSHPNKAPPLS